MVRLLVIDILISVLLFGASLFILTWENLKKNDYRLVRYIGFGIMFIFLKEIVNMLYQLFMLTDSFFIYSLLFEITGIGLIMFGMFNYLEDKMS